MSNVAKIERKDEDDLDLNLADDLDLELSDDPVVLAEEINNYGDRLSSIEAEIKRLRREKRELVSQLAARKARMIEKMREN